MVWLKIRKNDIIRKISIATKIVVVWLKIRKNDIKVYTHKDKDVVVVWLKIRKNDIKHGACATTNRLWFD